VSDDLVTRLREIGGKTVLEAAAEIEQLRAERTVLKGVLQHIASSGCPYETCVAIAESALRGAVPQTPPQSGT